MTELELVCHWICIGIDQGKDGIDVVWHGDERRWDFGITLKDLRMAQMRAGWR
jgi:hypothetical protein